MTDLPMLALCQNKGAVILEAILAIPGLLPTLRVRDLRKKYGIGNATACDILKRADS